MVSHEFRKILASVFGIFLSMTFATIIALSWNDVLRIYWRPTRSTGTTEEYTVKEKKKYILFATIMTLVGITVMVLFGFIVHKSMPKVAVSAELAEITE